MWTGKKAVVTAKPVGMKKEGSIVFDPPVVTAIKLKGIAKAVVARKLGQENGELRAFPVDSLCCYTMRSRF